MTHPLIDRLTRDMGWPLLDSSEDLAAFTEAEGTHAVFVPGDAARNLETPDVAVILPELRLAFQGRFDCAVATPALEDAIGQASGSFKTPNIVFYREGQVIGAIPRVRDWDDYMARIAHILAQPVAA